VIRSSQTRSLRQNTPSRRVGGTYIGRGPSKSIPK
jgi:hypothetical protein